MIGLIYVPGASRRAYNDFSVGVDPDGKDPNVVAVKRKSKGEITWEIKVCEKNKSSIQAAEGPWKGWYLTPGIEKIAVEFDGKTVDVGTQPVLSKDPAYFEIHEY